MQALESVINVSIHAPVKGATHADRIGEIFRVSFNPRTREGCDALRKYADELIRVSIHAPVKGATSSRQTPRISGLVSIHAPVKGATCRASPDCQLNQIVSIHAPVKGATVLFESHITRAFEKHFSRTSSFFDIEQGFV